MARNQYDYGYHDPSVADPNSANNGGGSNSGQTYDSNGQPIGIQTGPSTGSNQSGQGVTNQGGGSGGGLPVGSSGNAGQSVIDSYMGTGAAAPAASTPWYSSVGNFFTGASATGGALSTASQVLPWLQFAAAIYASQKSGTFVQPPMSADQKQMFDWAMHYIQTTPDNRQTINSILGYDLGHPATIDMEALKAGKVGYTPAGHMPGTDLATMIRNNAGAAGGASTSMPPPTSGMSGGQLADTIRSIQSP